MTDYWVAQTFVSRINFSDTHCYSGSTAALIKVTKIPKNSY